MPEGAEGLLETVSQRRDHLGVSRAPGRRRGGIWTKEHRMQTCVRASTNAAHQSWGQGETEEEREVRDAGESEDLHCP